jgi:hypothetical protein
LIEYNVVASDLSIEKLEENLAENDVRRLGKKLNRHKEVTC